MSVGDLQIRQKVSEYDKEISQTHTADQLHWNVSIVYDNQTSSILFKSGFLAIPGYSGENHCF